MSSLSFSRSACVLFAEAALLAACGGSQSPIGALRAIPQYTVSSQLSRGGYQVLYRFQGDSNGQLDGDSPRANLIAVKNQLYGTTAEGGEYNYSGCGAGKFFSGCGTVFAVSASGQERVLYRFAGGSDGYWPNAGLLALNGTLYGTTVSGGGLHCKKGYYGSCGTVFALSPSGQEEVLHRFTGPPDGARPAASLIAVDGTLYGTTVGGGALRAGCRRHGGCGVVFSVTPAGIERVVYAFKAARDGSAPSGPLLSVHGTLYGVTIAGGSGKCGTVFKLSTSGEERIVHTFNGSGDGCNPVGGLVAIDGGLYGITHYDIDGGVCDCGTVFKLTATGAESVIYRFAGGSDGTQPAAGLIAFKGALYGTTALGGRGCIGSQGCGTVFKVTTSGAERVLHAFEGDSDGVFTGGRTVGTARHTLRHHRGGRRLF